ncbi:MAG TPA: AAA family ATPase [Candidatus Limnocylindria bacterium]
MTGVPGAGKTTVCAALAKRYPLAAIVQADVFGDWIDAGSAADPWADHGSRVTLARRCATFCAREFAAAGLPVVIDDTVEDGTQADDYARRIGDLGPRRVLLRPTLETALARNAARANKPAGDAPHLDEIARRLYEPMRRALTAPAGWLVLDTTALDVAASVDAIVAHYGL